MLSYLLPILLGASLTLGFAPFSFWWVPYLSFTVFIVSLLQHNHHVFLRSWCFGLGYFGIGLSWVHVSIADYGGVPIIGSIALMLLLCGFLAIYPAIAFWFANKYFKPALWPIALGFSWLFIEWLRSWLFTGFPWLSIGYSQLHSPLSGLFPVVGEVGVSGLFLVIVTCFALAFNKRKHIYTCLSAPLVICITSLVLGQISWVKPDGRFIDVALVQGNIAQSMRWTPEEDAPTIKKYMRLTQPHWRNDLIIWPEAAIPTLEPVAIEQLSAIDHLATKNEASLVTGIVNYRFADKQVFNNLVALGLDTSTNNTIPYEYEHANRFAKHHLLPIGEFVPFESWLRQVAPIFNLPMSSFTRGEFQQANLLTKGIHLAPVICFEIAFPRQVRANLYDQTDAIITVSNDAWFGTSHGPDQHLEIAQIRAKEFGRPVFRSTNTGLTAFIDHRGEISSRLPQFKDAVLTERVSLVSGVTPYTYLNDYPLWVLFSLLLFISFRYRK